MRQLDLSTYENFVADRCDGFRAVAAIRHALSESRESGSRQVQRTIERVEAVLLRMVNQQGVSALDVYTFAQAYAAAGIGDEDQAHEARSLASAFPEFFLQPMADCIELVG